MLMKSINKFMFDKARYRLGDDSGNEIFVAIDYKMGNFRLIELRNVDEKMKKLKNEEGLVARDLLKRKRNVNFSDKINR